MGFMVITKPGCPFCDKAKALLSQKGLDYSEDVRDTPEAIETFKAKGYRTFPQVFEDARLIGGFDDLQLHFASLQDDDF